VPQDFGPGFPALHGLELAAAAQAPEFRHGHRVLVVLAVVAHREEDFGPGGAQSGHM